MPESKRGFAGMDREKQREIASKGGKAAHKLGTAHKFTSEEARTAGRKGGAKISQDREHMAKIGSLGGAARDRLRNIYKKNIAKFAVDSSESAS